MTESTAPRRSLNRINVRAISHAPVVSNGKLVGIISIHYFIEHIFQPRQRQTLGEIVGEKVPVLSIPVKGIMTKPVITALPETKLRDAAEKMRKFDISSLVVVRKRRPVGVVTKRDFLEPIAQMEKGKKKAYRPVFGQGCGNRRDSTWLNGG